MTDKPMKNKDLVISPPDFTQPLEIMNFKQVMQLLYDIKARNATKIFSRVVARKRPSLGLVAP
jgi:hypothetical protein